MARTGANAQEHARVIDLPMIRSVVSVIRDASRSTDELDRIGADAKQPLLPNLKQLSQNESGAQVGKSQAHERPIDAQNECA
jgi:hypothetical protein